MRVSSTYEHALQAAYCHIGSRGIRIDPDRLTYARQVVKAEIARWLAVAANQWGCKVFIGADNNPAKDDIDAIGAVNLNATQGRYALLTKLRDLGYELPKITKKDSDGNYESKESTEELALQKILSKNQFNYPGGDPAIRAVLKIREMAKLSSAYLNAQLIQRGGEVYFLSNYNVAGTLSGRRSSRKHTFRYGNNAQNFPKHSDNAGLYRRCLVSRPGHIFLMVDQISAEDWPVCALSENYRALQELADTSDLYGRHTRLASTIFNILLASRSVGEWKDSIERYLGKKTRHASNYDMTAPCMSEALAKEAFSFSVADCDKLLTKMNQIDPNVKAVFHKYVRDKINKDRVLISPEPFLRERQFLGARPNDANNSLFKEAYSWIPQGTVGDNTGFAVVSLETNYPDNERYIVQEGHDSIVQDVPDDAETIFKTLLRTGVAFDRTIKFHNGIEIKIPIEAEIGYDFATTVRIKEFTLASCKEAQERLRDKISKQNQERNVMVTI
jgi:DNA polymerase family A